MEKGKVVSIEDRIPKLKQQRRKKANRRLITLLLLFFSIIVCVVYFQSPLSHVKHIKVQGNKVYSEKYLVQLSKITKETNIWKVDKNEISKQIRKLPEIKSVSVSVHVPNDIVIKVDEYERIAYLTKGAKFWPVLENGNILEDQKTKNIPVNAPVLLGFSEGSVTKEMIKEIKKLPEVVLNSISEINYDPKQTDKFHITLFMNDGFEVSASLRNFSEKMSHYPSIKSQLDPNKKGVIDLEVGSFFKAYELEGAEKSENEGEG